MNRKLNIIYAAPDGRRERRNNMKLKKLASLALAGALTLGLLPAFSFPALAADGDTSYTLTIPSTLTVANSGWNATDGISATGSLASGKKLTVTASSANSWALKQQDGNETVSYTMKETSDGAAKNAWEFTTLPGSATLGIDVADYSTKPAGTYQDTVTFTASVVSAAKKLTLTGEYFDFNNGDFVNKSLTIEYTDNDTWKDIAERYDDVSLRDSSAGPEGKIIKFWYDRSQGINGCELKSKESTYQYDLVSINDKVSAYSSYFLD